ncbi:MAG: PKD domain-containing protein, partial [Thermomicrobium sp.]|nr:PKD domain-containing protein [Thermomicrobium sp.]
TASNGYGAVSATVTVEVIQPVRITSFRVDPAEVRPNEPFRLSWTTENATQVVISQGLGTRPLSGAVTLYVPVETTYTIVASNKLSTDTATVTIRVRAGVTNRNPVANAGPDFETTAFEVSLDGSTSNDPDGDVLSFSWRQVSGPPAAITGANTARPRVQFPAPGIYEFELTVTDPGGLTSTDRVRVTYRRI